MSACHPLVSRSLFDLRTLLNTIQPSIALKKNNAAVLTTIGTGTGTRRSAINTVPTNHKNVAVNEFMLRDT